MHTKHGKSVTDFQAILTLIAMALLHIYTKYLI